MDKAYKNLKKINSFLYLIDYDTVNYEKAYAYMEEHFKNGDGGIPTGACSAVNKGTLLGKNLDWKYGDCVNFLVNVKGTNESWGVAGGLPSFNRTFMSKGEYSEDYEILPFMMNSGFNDKGLRVALNVVPLGDDVNEIPYEPTTGTNPSATDEAICAAMLPRFILDNYQSAQTAVTALQSKDIYCPYGEKMTEDLHLLISDSSKSFIVEFVGNETKVMDVTDKPWMTNFYEFGAAFDDDNYVDYETLSDHATGVTRSNIIADNYDLINDAGAMLDLMQNKLKFSNTYKNRVVDEFCGDYSDTPYGDLTIKKAMEQPGLFDEIIDKESAEYEARIRDKSNVWITNHSVVYDVSNFKIYIVVEEQGLNNTFIFERSKDMAKYGELANGLKTLSKTDYDALPANAQGVKEATGIPNGTQLEVLDYATGKVTVYAEAFDELWFER